MFKRTYAFLLSLATVGSLSLASPALAQRDAVDISTAIVWNSPQDVASWPITSRLASMTETPESGPDPGFVLNFDARQRWPNYTPPGWDGPLQYTIWAGVKINGVWNISGFIQMWRERVATGAPILEFGPGCVVNNFACNWAYDGRWGALAGYQPRAGEEMIFFATAGNARGVGTVTSLRERTNVVKIALPANDSGSWTFPLALTDLIVDFGSTGLWALTDAAYFNQLHPMNPKLIAATDMDGNGIDEVIVDFGAPYGIWTRWNNATWAQLHPLTANSIITGDIDGNGRGDVIIDFPTYGVFAFMNGTSWVQIHTLNASKMAITSTGTLVMNFPGLGVWLRTKTGTWSQLHTLNTTVFATGDFDGDAVPDVVLSWPGVGVWVYSGLGTWTKINNSDASNVAVGALDAGARDDMVLDFPGQGVWAYRNLSVWTQIKPYSAKSFLLANLNGNNVDDLVIDFGPSLGVWVYVDLATWIQATPSTTEGFIKANLN